VPFLGEDILLGRLATYWVGRHVIIWVGA
jgi:hypothetical protein